MKKGRIPLLSTTALARSVKLAVATGAMMLSTTAWAVDDLATPVGENVVGGSASFDRPNAGQLNINQNTDRVVINWDSFNIGRNGVTQFYQPGSNSLAVNRVVSAGQDPTQILGTLNANGRVMVLDRNGVLFGHEARLDVGGIIASTGDVDTAAIMSGANIFELKDFGDGSVVNNGMITAADAGLVAFVGKHVANNGVISAKLGKIALAAGSTKATVDLYGDGLVEFALDGAKTKVLASNDGVINAEGGTVAMTASAAKDVVDDVINMKGVVNVSSVTVKGGKIILNGGTSGNVSVTGNMAASGEQGGGDVVVTGKNVEVLGTIANNAGSNGDGGNTLIYGQDYAIFNGNLFGRGGSASGNGGQAEVSAGKGVGYYGYTDLSATNGESGTLTIDPEFLTISNAAFSGNLAYFLSLGILGTVNINDQAIANALRNNNVKLWASNTLSVTEDVDVSTWEQKNYVFSFPFCLFGCYSGSTYGITSKDLTLAAPTINLTNDIILGTGKLNIHDVDNTDSVLGYGIINAPAGGIFVDVVNLNGIIGRRSTVGGVVTEAGDDQINSQANTVNVQSNAARIQQGVYLSNDDAQGTVNVAAGLYNESVNVAKNVKLLGANQGQHGYFHTNPETIVDPNSPGFYFGAGSDGSILDGFVVTGATDNGVHIQDASNITIKNNIIHDVDGDGIYADGADGLVATGNYIHNIRTKGTDIGSGIHILNTFGAQVGSPAGTTNLSDYNFITDTDWDGVRVVDSTDVDVVYNQIEAVDRTGIFLGNTEGALAQYNYIATTGRWGINADRGESVTIDGNSVSNTGFDGIRIFKLKGAENKVTSNIIDLTGQVYEFGKTGHGILLDSSQSLLVSSNYIGLYGGAENIRGDGIYGFNIGGAVIRRNEITNTKSLGQDRGSGIQIVGTAGATIGGPGPFDGNIIYNTGWDGIRVVDSSAITAQRNDIDNVYRTGLYFGNTLNSFLLGNFVTHTVDRYGINIDGGDSITVTGNDIDDTNRHGIYVHGVTGLNLVNDNYVDSTRNGNSQGDGIHAEFVSFLTVSGNKVGLGSGVNKVKGDGIFVADSDFAWIHSNEITNTQSTAVDIGSGIHVQRSDFTTVGGFGYENKIYKTGWDGVRFIDSGYSFVQANDIDDVFRTGIYMGNMWGSFVLDNFVTKTKERYGINIDQSRDMTVTGNDVDDTQLNGIRIYRTKGTNLVANNYVDTTRRAGGILAEMVEGLTIDNNYVGTTVVGPNINGDGILSIKSHGVVITSNTITNTKSPMNDVGSGIQVQDTNGATIGGPNPGDANTIFNTAWDGIRVVRSNTVLAQANDIDDVYRTGIYFGEVADGDILDNFIDGTTDRYGINYDGGSDATISGNDVDNTNRHGIWIHDVGGTANTVTANMVDFTNGGNGEGDGIHATDVVALDITGNFIGMNGGGIWGNGIYVDPSNSANISYNNIYDVGQNGILSEYNDDVTMYRNYVDASTMNGIWVRYGNNVTIGAPNDGELSYGNTVSNSGQHGIWVEGTTGDIIIKNNNVTHSGVNGGGESGDLGDGIRVTNIYGGGDDYDDYDKVVFLFGGNNYVEIADNYVDDTHDDGIEVNGVEGTVYIHNNTILNIGQGVSESYVYGDYYGADGIHVANVRSSDACGGYYCAPFAAKVDPSGSYDVRIVDNDIDTTNDDGIEVIYSGRTLIQGNDIVDVGFGNGQYYDDGYGADGIHVREVFANTMYYPTLSLFDPFPAIGMDSSVDILDNRVNVDRETGEFIGFTADDGIQVLDSGDTAIDSNQVANSGMTPEEEEEEGEYEYEYKRNYIFAYGSKSDEWGADGIHVLNRPYYAEGKGIQALDYDGYYYGYHEPVSVEITNNFVDNSQDDGIEVDGANYVFVDSNDVDVSGDVGILLRGYGSGYIAPPVVDDQPIEDIVLFEVLPDPYLWTAIVTNNTVNNSIHDGAQIIDFDNIEASFNTISNSGNTPEQTGAGIHIDGAYNGTVNVEGNVLTDNRVGAEFNSGLIYLTGASNTIVRGDVGLRFSPFQTMTEEGPVSAYLELFDDDDEPDSLSSEDPPTNFGGTIGAQIFQDQSQYFVELLNGAFYAPGTPTWLNGLNSTYTADGITVTPSLTGGILTAEEYDMLENRFWHWIDDPAVGRFWFGQVPANILQERILNTFGAFEDLGGEINVLLLGLPSLPGGGTPPPTDIASLLNNLTPNAGDETNPADIEPAAGGIEPAAGPGPQTAENNSSCWFDATVSAQAGATTTFSFSSVIDQSTLAQQTNCGNGQ